MWFLEREHTDFGQAPASAGQRSAGFTLVEILLAVAILGIIVVMVYGSLWTVTRTVVDARERMELYQTARGFLWRMSGELSNAFVSEEIDFVAVKSNEPNSADTYRLSFSSTTGGFGQDSKDIGRIEYYLSEGVLYKAVAGKTFPVVENVDSLSLRYFDGGQWRENWNSKPGSKLPKTVEINLELEGEIFSTAVSIPLAGGAGVGVVR
jgi:general secretion pathway protein J